MDPVVPRVDPRRTTPGAVVITTITIMIMVAAMTGGSRSAPEACPEPVAQAFARKLLRADEIDTAYHATYRNLDGTPHACVFVCRPRPPRENGETVLTLGVAADREHFPLLFYYFDDPVDISMKDPAKVPEPSHVVLTDVGVFFQSGSTFYEWPRLDAVGMNELAERTKAHGRGKAEEEPKGRRPLSLPSGRMSAAWASVEASLTAPQDAEADPVEVVMPGVPNYLWYLNCLLTAETMILGYWNDHGFDGFVPGGDSTNGFYWAITEELCWIEGFGTRVSYYTEAREYGNRSPFTTSGFLGKEWDDYVATVDTYLTPLSVSWAGAPYGNHATVGVGYREADSQRFLILHDTWVPRLAYVNYDQYRETLQGFYRYHPVAPSPPAGPGGSRPVEVVEGGISLRPAVHEFDPPLSPQRYGYHCMEGVDIDNDDRLDLVVCNFSLVGRQALKLYMNRGGRFVEETGFAPVLESFECLHVAKAEDFDRDGDMDVAATGYWSRVRVYVNQGGTLSSAGILLDDEGRGFTDVAWGDYDGDGDSDLASATLLGKVRVYRNDGGTFVRLPEIGSGRQYRQIRFFELSGDAYPELLACDRSGSVVAFANDGGNLSGELYFSPSSGHGAMAFDVADINRDGFPEIVTVDDGKLAIFHNDGGRLAESPEVLDTGFEFFAKDLAVTDLDGDGYPELIVGNYNRHDVIFRNLNGEFQPDPIWMSARIEPTERIHLFDRLDGGGPEVLFLKARGGNVEFFEILPLVEGDFRRGDATTNGRLTIGDVILILLQVFGKGPFLCADASDVTDNGKVELADALQLLVYLFTGTGPPADPFPGCGRDPKEDLLGCEQYGACP